MGLKSLHFESPGRRNFNVFAQLNFIYARSVKIAPLPYENLIFAYARLPKMSKKSYKNPSKRPSKSISSCKGSWNPKNHDFHVKNIDFQVAKNSGFFSKSGRGGGYNVGCSWCFCCNAVFFGFLGVLGRFLDPIWTRFSTDFLYFRGPGAVFGTDLDQIVDRFSVFRASCSHGSLPLRGLVGMREA